MILIKLGSRGNNVRKWQRFLIGQGFPVRVDGDFGPETHGATVEFQDRNGLVPDGKVGDRTLGQAMLLGFTIVDDPEDMSMTGPKWIDARLSVVATADGGRKHGICTGYRACWDNGDTLATGDTHFHDAPVAVDGEELITFGECWVHPGETGQVRLHP